MSEDESSLIEKYETLLKKYKKISEILIQTERNIEEKLKDWNHRLERNMAFLEQSIEDNRMLRPYVKEYALDRSRRNLYPREELRCSNPFPPSN